MTTSQPPQTLLQRLLLSDNQLALSILALAAGLLAALVITLFRLAIEWPLELFLPMQDEDDYEALTNTLRIALLLAGGLLLILMFQPLAPQQRSMGVTHVLMRMEHHQGYMPLANVVRQWFAAAIALLSGHSVGREGPAIHLGAGSASLLGVYSGVAHHRLRILAAAGVASAISASFNTPMAGVIFAMEVVLLQYNLRGFIPIILASVAGAVVSQLVFGSATAFQVPALAMESLLELPYVVTLGLVCGGLAALFIVLMKRFQQTMPSSLWLRWGGLTLLTALLSWWLPGIMGIGYDTVNEALVGQVSPGLFGLLLLAKLVLAAWAAGVGFPAGLIGPSLFIGALAGAIMAQLSLQLIPGFELETGFYVMLGMGAMMGAVLRAPLAALVAMLELTGNPNIIMPGMLAIVIATLVASELFRQPSIFRAQLGENDLYMTPHPVRQMLAATWVVHAVSRSVVVTERQITPASAQQLLDRNIDWLLLEQDDVIVSIAAVASALESRDEQLTRESEQDNEADSAPEANDALIDLLEIPAERHACQPIAIKASLLDALEQMQDHDLQWLAVYRRDPSSRHGPGPCVGLVSREMIERHYHYRPTTSRKPITNP